MNANRSVRKVVIPVAGMGTRFLPVTKALPKELLPIVSTPIIQFIVEECISAGIETIVLVTSRPKILIEDYFDPHDLTSYKLHDLGKDSGIEQVIELSKKIEIVSVRQYEPAGLGHAILQAEPVVRDQNFAVVLGDDLILNNGGPSAIGQCVNGFRKQESGSVIGAVEVPKEDVSMYGIMRLNGAVTPDGLKSIKGFVEKPSPAEAPSNWAMPGRYVFEPALLRYLRETPPGRGNEIQLTDAMQLMLQGNDPFFACLLKGERHDTGDKLGYIKANVAVALRDPALKGKLREWLVEKLSS